jgi:hypothetical protein
MSTDFAPSLCNRVLDRFGPPPTDDRAAALDAWARGGEPPLILEAEDRVNKMGRESAEDGVRKSHGATKPSRTRPFTGT